VDLGVAGSIPVTRPTLNRRNKTLISDHEPPPGGSFPGLCVASIWI
jgi:hypothetical protein